MVESVALFVLITTTFLLCGYLGAVILFPEKF